MTQAISVRDLRVTYGAIEALSGVSLDVNPGEIVAVLGANGAGKTTLLSAVAGLVRPRSGEILIDGNSTRGQLAEHIARKGVRLVPEGRRIFTRLNVEENLRLGAYFVPTAIFRKRFDRLASLFPILGEKRHSFAGYLSGGEQQIVALSRALISEPHILLLDEPSAGLSPIATTTVYQSLRQVAEDSKLSILLVEQNVNAALAIATRGYVLELGVVKLSGERQQLASDERVRTLYLGAENENQED